MSDRGRAPLRVAAILLAILLMAAVQPVRTGAAGRPATFTWSPVTAPAPPGLVPDAITFGGDRFVLMGSVTDMGNPVWFGASTEAETWTFTAVKPQQELRQLVYGNGLFLAHWSFEAVGDVATSTDGVNWQVQSMIPFPVLYRAVYGQGRFVAADPVGGDIRHSTDGFTWSPVPVGPWRIHPLDSFWSFADVIFDGSRFLATGEAYNTRANAYSWSIFESADGLTWSVLSSNPPPCASQIRYRNGRYVVLGDAEHPGISSSDNGLAWYPCTTPVAAPTTDPAPPATDFAGRLLYDVAGYFVIPDLTAHKLYLSVDGIEWWTESLPADAGELLAWGNGNATGMKPPRPSRCARAP